MKCSIHGAIPLRHLFINSRYGGIKQRMRTKDLAEKKGKTCSMRVESATQCRFSLPPVSLLIPSSVEGKNT